MTFVKRVFPYGFRRNQGGTRTFRARFESIAIGSYLALQKDSTLAKRDVEVTKWLPGQEFKDVTGADGANAIARLRSRLHFVCDKLLGA